nr:DUF2752 domain-containing protein [Amycolatopsis arida]
MLRALGPPLAVVAGGAVCAGVLLWADPTTPGGPLPVCPTKALFGLTCPGCGTLRMLYSLLHADVGAALHFNAVAVAALPLLAWSMAAWTVVRLRGRPVRTWQQWRWAPAVIGIVFVGWFVLRNLPFAPFAALKV